MFDLRLCFFLSCLPCVFVFLPMPPKLRAEDEDSSSDTESELGSGPSSVEILALNDRMSTALELVTEHLAAVTGGTGGQRQREPEGLDDRKSVADFVAVLGVYARASSASDA